MKKFFRILLVIAVWATITWIFREKLLPMPKPDPGPPPHFRADRAPAAMPAEGAAATTPQPEAATAAAVPAPVPAADDLQRVKGIGPVYQHRLAEIGISNFDELMAGDPADIAEKIDASEAQVVEWLSQARDLND